jgi:hypothetical protein
MTFEAALDAWNAMTPMARYAVMQRVGYMKSLAKWNRACVALIQKEGA